MGIPDTFVMPIYHTQIFTATAEETSSSNSSTQEYMPTCTQVFCTALFNYNKKDQDQPRTSVFLDGDSSSVLLTCEDIKKFTAAEIEKATDNYNEQNIIGQGGCGIVYKGILPGDQLIAIKRPRYIFPTHITEQLVNEINALSKINNKNVVKLIGFCFEGEMPSIVYEYITNGTLYDHLFDERKSCLLTWNHRLRIGLQVAQVLAYLHTIPIIHMDIKPLNILLDDNYTVKLIDFGISMFDQNEFTKLIEDIWTKVLGTPGYIDPDPDDFFNGRLPTKRDVYSFGVVLAELLTRKKALFAMGEAKVVHLTSIFKKNLMDDCLVEILDEQLVNEVSMEQLMKVAHLAGRCLQRKAGDRPTMMQVVKKLQDISGF